MSEDWESRKVGNHRELQPKSFGPRDGMKLNSKAEQGAADLRFYCHSSDGQPRLITIHDRVPGRVRFRHAGLRDNLPLADIVQARLMTLPGVIAARVSPLTGSVLVRFRSPATGSILAAALGSWIAHESGSCSGWRLEGAAGFSAAMAPPFRRVEEGSPWHSLEAAAVLRQLGVWSHQGLDPIDVTARRLEHGLNELPRAEPRSAAAIFVDQLGSLPVLLLGASAGLSILTGGLADAAVILSVILLNAGIATATERQAERTIVGLSRYRAQQVPVRRAGTRQLVDPSELVPGDILMVEPGMLIPADLRLLEDGELMVNESALTGESLPVHKDSGILVRSDTALADRPNMMFRGTAVTGGKGLAVVTSTGSATEIGRIQALLGNVRPPETPIQRQLGEVGRELVLINGAICAVVFGLGMLRGHGLLPMLRSAISLAVAAVPEGLPAVATTTLALGVQTMRRRQVLVRKLEAVETLGAVEIVGLDKTGTLTTNRMTVVAAHTDGNFLDLNNARITGTEDVIAPKAVLERLCEVAVLCSEARLATGATGAEIVGTPTETAILRMAMDLGTDIRQLRSRFPVLELVPRSEGRKRISTLHGAAGKRRLLCVKGDPVEVLSRCVSQLTSAGPAGLDESVRESILRANEKMAGRALRVLGVAVRDQGGDPSDERDLTWLGLIGMADPLRPGVGAAIHKLHGAGIRTLMITGDQSATAFAIARDLNLGNGGDIRILDTGQLQGMRPDILAALAPQAQVFARISPVNKLQIVRALQKGGRIVAMTGDGINDGPALRAADIGIAMGAAGTDVAREVADIVLGNDDLAGIIEAVRLGRATYANIRKVLHYLVATNASETLVMLGASIVGWAAPLSPMQMLWLNLASDVLPALALGLDPPELDVLAQPPHDPRAPILTAVDFRRLVREGAVLGIGALAAYLAAGSGHLGGTADAATQVRQTLVFHGLTIAQLVHALTCRSETHGLIEELRRPPNIKLYAALAASLGLQAGAQMVPLLRRLLGLAPLNGRGLGIILAAAIGPLIANEALTAVLRRPDGLPET
jgi:Ca2+-transporting ATPase